ncbi:hypothetical protein QE152_g6948 [Popillia japonica]|uniref:Retrotransposon gag domain-containing protein n=1 Tax=Popillia japonica TaxID=7064 RepID=A0AAW1MG92_POPJA
MFIAFSILADDLVRLTSFLSCNQNESQTIDQYVTELKQKAADCGFGSLKDSLIKDRLVCGILSDHLREKLLGEKSLTLINCVNICRADEESRKQVKVTAAGTHNGNTLK